MFRTLNYLDEVCREQSFSRAAQNLYISQPSLSLTIKKLENEIGLQIFDRCTTPIQLTEAGKTYMEGVRQILAVKANLDTFVDEYNDLKCGLLTLGAPHLFSSYLLPALISQFSSIYPKIEIRLVEADFLTLQSMMAGGEIDLLIESHTFDETLFRNYPIIPEHLLLAVPSSDPINARLKGFSLTAKDIRNDRHLDVSQPSVQLSSFRDHTFLMLHKGNDMHTRAMHLFHVNDIEPRVFIYLNQLLTLFNMVNQQIGVSFVTDTLVKLCCKDEKITFYKIEDDQVTRYINLAHKLNRYITKSMQEFIRMMSEFQIGSIVNIANPARGK